MLTPTSPRRPRSGASRSACCRRRVPHLRPLRLRLGGRPRHHDRSTPARSPLRRAPGRLGATWSTRPTLRKRGPALYETLPARQQPGSISRPDQLVGHARCRVLTLAPGHEPYKGFSWSAARNETGEPEGYVRYRTDGTLDRPPAERPPVHRRAARRHPRGLRAPVAILLRGRLGRARCGPTIAARRGVAVDAGRRPPRRGSGPVGLPLGAAARRPGAARRPHVPHARARRARGGRPARATPPAASSWTAARTAPRAPGPTSRPGLTLDVDALGADRPRRPLAADAGCRRPGRRPRCRRPRHRRRHVPRRRHRRGAPPGSEPSARLDGTRRTAAHRASEPQLGQQQVCRARRRWVASRVVVVRVEQQRHQAGGLRPTHVVADAVADVGDAPSGRRRARRAPNEDRRIGLRSRPTTCGVDHAQRPAHPRPRPTWQTPCAASTPSI